MKAPDKIYLEKSLSYPDRLHSQWYPNDVIGGGTEYVRKDALIEWAENWKQLGQSDDFMYAIETLVQHLNSM